MNTADSFAAWTERLAERPEIYPHQLNLVNDSLLLVNLTADEIKAAPFLDQRVLGQQTKGQWVAWQAVAEIFDGQANRDFPGFIFHVGHCGSTLLSRLMEFAGGTRCLREPLPLRTLAQEAADHGEGRSFLTGQERHRRLQWFARMWARGANHTVVKATSICTGLLAEIQALEPAARAVFLYNRPETHIATLLAGQNALVDLKGFAQLRMQRLRRASGLDLRLNRLATGQLAALGWLSETVSVTRALADHPERTVLLEFESLLQDPAGQLSQTLGHLGIPISQQSVEAAVSGSVLRTYSKAPEHEYNAQTRLAILNDSRARFRQEISAGLAWLEQLAGQSRVVAGAMQACG
jgi:hypothetical protein